MQEASVNLFDFIILALATWRLASLFSREDGPAGIFASLRYKAGVRYDAFSKPYPKNGFARGLICVWCNSIWIATTLAVAYYFVPSFTLWICYPLALSAGAICIESIGGHNGTHL